MRAIIDVDATLWSLHDVLLPILNKQYGVPLELPKVWNFYRPYMTDDQFYKVVDAAHEEQWSANPFVGASDLFRLFDRFEVEVIVASQRNPKFLEELTRWLGIHGLSPFAGVYAGYDKKFLIDDAEFVIDDNPSTMKYALNLGCRVLSIRWPWNMDVPGAILFGDIPEMVRWLKVELEVQ